mmetsp:Transcript_17342/g.33998  ORF Transcript_17342/g.33998 Transcript_17342/m.33998 type:complete len:178 (-) Transcript_17342:89-622(-)
MAQELDDSAGSPIPARLGRENQRYDDSGRRLTAGCVVRRGDEVLMISSSKDPNKFIIPKGGWENDETIEEAAMRETLEESGVRVLLGTMVGWFDCPSGGGARARDCARSGRSVCRRWIHGLRERGCANGWERTRRLQCAGIPIWDASLSWPLSSRKRVSNHIYIYMGRIIELAFQQS